VSAVREFYTFLDIIRRRWLVIVLVAIAGTIAASYLVLVVPRTYEATASVLIVNESDGRDPSVSSIDLPSVAASTNVLQRVADDLKLPESLGEMKKNVKAHVTAHSSIMEIAYRDASRDRAVAVSNGIADELARYYGEISTHRADENVRKLAAATAAVQKQLRVVDLRIAKATAAEPDVGTDKAIDTIAARIDDLSTQRELATAALTNDQAQLQAVAGNGAMLSRVSAHEILQNDQYYTALQDSESKDESQLARDRVAFTDAYPGIATLEKQVEEQRKALAAERQRALSSKQGFSPSQAASVMESRRAAALVAGDRAKVAALDSLLAAEHSQLNDPLASVDVSALRRQRDALQADYLTLSARQTLAIASRAEALSLGSVVVVDRAVRADSEIVGLSRSTLASLCAFFIVALALGIALVLEWLDPRLHRAAQVERLYGSPVIASLKTNRNSDSTLSARLQFLRAKIESSMPLPCVMLMTSACPGDGDSITAAALADCFARAGHNTAIVDANMDGPANDREIYPAVATIAEWTANSVTALPARAPSRAILSEGSLRSSSPESVRAFVAEMRLEFDITIVNVGPVLAKSIAIALAREVDSVLLTVRLERRATEEDELTTFVLENAPGKVLGIVTTTSESLALLARGQESGCDSPVVALGSSENGHGDPEIASSSMAFALVKKVRT
jgi:capsular polysaccharide biosynthesis protein